MIINNEEEIKGVTMVNKKVDSERRNVLEEQILFKRKNVSFVENKATKKMIAMLRMEGPLIRKKLQQRRQAKRTEVQKKSQ